MPRLGRDEDTPEGSGRAGEHDPSFVNDIGVTLDGPGGPCGPTGPRLANFLENRLANFMEYRFEYLLAKFLTSLLCLSGSPPAA
jgi:hypothetical protein